MRQRLFVNKVTGLSKLTIKTPKWRHWRSFGVFIVNFERPATLLKKSLWHWCFPANFKKISKNTFFTEHLWATASAFPNVRAPIFTFASKRFLHRIWWRHKFNRYKIKKKDFLKRRARKVLTMKYGQLVEHLITKVLMKNFF